MKVKKSTKPSFPRSFGAFSPTGHVVSALTTDADAEKARQTLLRNGFGEEEVTHYNKDEVLWEFMRNENHAISPVQIGQEAARFEEYLELAGQGCGFLVVHTPEDEVAKPPFPLFIPFDFTFPKNSNRCTLEQ